MTEDEMNEMLRQVAAGDLAPDEATRRIEAGRRTETTTDDRTRELPRGEPSGDVLRTVRIVANAGMVRIVGDSAVAEAVVEGDHEMRRNGDELVIECASLFRAFGRDEPVGAYASMSGRPRRRLPFGLIGGERQPVRIRVNPELGLDVDLAAGSLSIQDVRGPITAMVNAGSASMRGVRGPFECSVNAGSLTISALVDSGSSRVNCDMGAANIRLERGSDVRVEAETTLGRAEVRLPRAHDGNGWVLGRGQAELLVHGTMSSVSVTEA